MTRSDPCVRLDEFLAGDLAGEPRDDFERHLLDCPHCQEEAESYSRLAEILQTAEQQQVSCPPALPGRVRQEISSRRLRRRIAAAAAAIVLIAVAGFAWIAGERSGPPKTADERDRMTVRAPQEPQEDTAAVRHSEVRVGAATDPALPPSELPTRQSAVVSVEFNDDVIGVPIETDDPSVTILWVYPTLGRMAGGD